MEQKNQELSIFFNGYISHLKSNKQKRSFDLTKNGKGSRYLLVKEFTDNHTYNGRLINVINFTTLKNDIKINTKADASIMFYYKNNEVTMNLGYNIWGKTKEKIKIKEFFKENKYGFLGIIPTDNINTSPTAGDTSGNKANGVLKDIHIDGSWTQQENTASSNNLIKNSDINKQSAEAPSSISHKIFTHIQYNWINKNHNPSLGLGGEIEFCGNDNKSINQWEIWIKFASDF